MSEFQNKLINNCDVLKDILIEKNKKYKDSFTGTMDKYGDTTILIRLNDKIQRLEAFLLDKQKPLIDEGLLDTLLDIAGYAILARAYYENKESVDDDVVGDTDKLSTYFISNK